MEKTIKVINRMKKEGVIEDYAVGGAMGAIFYVEPFATYDLDIFFVAKSAESGLAILEPVYDYLRPLGYRPEGEAVNIEGLPVQFLPVFNPLIDEAVKKANVLKLNKTPVRVMRPEHLVAIMLNTGRAKDYARIDQFIHNSAVDIDSLSDLLSRHRLNRKWREFERKFLR
ncbi:MAG TPA: hypothetical protein VF708_07250 [Pyrinomonadaceae bacterium]|jgi:hypothetical protein